jgi:hypothetical protein
MSAAEPAHPTPGGPPATVILFPKRATRRRGRRGEETVTGSPAPGASPEHPPTSHQRLADGAEEWFLRHGRRTLTDPETQEVFLVTLNLVTSLLEGARVHGVVGDQAHGELQAMIDGLKAAPELL